MGKNSFIVYNEWDETFNELSNEDAGKLIKTMFVYSKSKQLPALPALLRMAFIPIKQQMDRNTLQYDKISKLRSEFGRVGGLAKASKSKLKPVLLSKPAVEDEDEGINTNTVQPTFKEPTTNTPKSHLLMRKAAEPTRAGAGDPTAADFNKYMQLADDLSAKHQGAR